MKNHLSNSLSPYLQDHADDPVHWYPWSDDALARAKKENKPIFLSIGYASCHWCHVMARESFQDEQTAELLNQFFICIKVDREERPDIDDIYMEALIGLNGHGGWPMSLFLTPDKVPFFAGTYFPKLPRNGQMAFVELIGRIVTLWHKHPNDVKNIALEINTRINQAMPLNKNEIELSIWLDEIEKMVDFKYGGLSGAPKFPQLSLWQGILVGASLYQKNNLLDACYLTASSLLMGGIYDHLDGGIARYCVDDQWHMPHFEKMLSDNAWFIHFLADLYAFRTHDWFEEKANHIKSWLLEHLQSQSGVFGSSMDAEALGEEGRPYVWSWASVSAILGEDLDEAKHYFNWEKPKNINEPCLILDTIQLEEKVFDDKVIARILSALKIARQEMPQPRVDDKAILDWHMALIASMAKASLAFKDASWLELAKKTYLACETIFYIDGRWHHAARHNQLGENLFLDDLANLMYAQIQLYAATNDQIYLEKVKETYECLELYWDHDCNLYHMNELNTEDMIKNPMPIMDDSTPSGNALMATNFALMELITGESKYTQRCDALLITGLSQISPVSMGQWMVAKQVQTNGKLIKGDWMDRSETLELKPHWLLIQDKSIKGIQFCDKEGCHSDITSMPDLINRS